MASRQIDWIELVTGFSCNCRCVVCPSSYLDEPRAMSLSEMTGALQRGRELGAAGAWFGGGEPTLHRELPQAVIAARRLGYRDIRLQTNGLRLAYAKYARELVRLGVNRVALSVMGHDDDGHDAITRYPGSFDLVTKAAENLAGLGVALEADVLITSRNAGDLEEIVRRFSELGVSAFNFWLVSLHGLDRASLSGWVPPLSGIVPGLHAAFARADAVGARSGTLHLPPCVLEARYRDRYFHAGQWNLLVVTPGSEPFMAESSPMEGGVYLDGCARCTYRERCLGLRADYLQLHGPGGFEPVAP